MDPIKQATFINTDGMEDVVRLGQLIGFNADGGQIGVITKIERIILPKSRVGYLLTVANEWGYSGTYLGGKHEAKVLANATWPYQM